MKILFLSNNQISAPLFRWLAEREDVTVLRGKISREHLGRLRPDWVVSYSYRHLLEDDVLRVLPGRFLNLHISLLPYNRGADPNTWSFLEDTPKGVSIHLIDAGIDTGPTLVQREIAFEDAGVTLAESYRSLHAQLRALFIENWACLRLGEIDPQPQTGAGSFHRSVEFAAMRDRLLGPQGWNVTVRLLKQRFQQMANSAQT